MGFNLLVPMSFEVSTVTTMDSQEPASCDNSHLLGFLTKYVGANMQLPYKARFGGAKFGRGWGLAPSPGHSQILSRSRDKIWEWPGDEARCQLMYGSLTHLRGAHKLLVGSTHKFSELNFLR